MIGRLLLALLLAAFAVPAAAATPVCHAERAASAMAHHPSPTAPDPALTAQHVCVGCVPMADWTGDRITARIVPSPADPDTDIVRLDLRRAVAPALPPPRKA